MGKPSRGDVKAESRGNRKWDVYEACSLFPNKSMHLVDLVELERYFQHKVCSSLLHPFYFEGTFLKHDAAADFSFC